eukprot:SM000019S05013  [mRNA]  locus=s19:419767:423695:- [translate_table: standard]
MYSPLSSSAAATACKADHPSALDHFGEVTGLAQGKQLALFLDYDGTLSPIIEDPERAFMTDQMRAAVKDVAAHFPTAIISGRGREKVYSFVQLSELFYAGSHGLDIMGPANGYGGVTADGQVGDRVIYQPAQEFLPLMDEICGTLKDRLTLIEGASIEHNKFCITVHFRRVREESWQELATIVTDVIKQYPNIKTTFGRKVLEVRPVVEWNKGKAVAYLLKALGLENDHTVLPVYIGDDRTDEDAFSLLKERGSGCGIVVSRVAKPTTASYSLRDPPEVMAFLRRLVSWREHDNQTLN